MLRLVSGSCFEPLNAEIRVTFISRERHLNVRVVGGAAARSRRGGEASPSTPPPPQYRQYGRHTGSGGRGRGCPANVVRVPSPPSGGRGVEVEGGCGGGVETGGAAWWGRLEQREE